MKKLFLIALTASWLAGNAYAIDCDPAKCGPADSDDFSKLGALYAQGVPATAEDVLGWYAGRCFFSNTPSTARNSVTVGWIEDVDSDKGPLFPPRKGLKITGLHNFDVPADQYDTLTPTTEYSIANWLNGPPGKASVNETYVQNNELVASWTPDQGELFLRKSGDFLVMQLAGPGPDKRATVAANCYQFIKLK